MKALAAILLLVSLPAWGDTWLVATVGSYHLERNPKYCETNLGIGFEYGNDWRLIAGQYQNSLCLPSNYIGVSYSVVKWHDFRLAASGLVFTGYNRDKKTGRDHPVPALLPSLSYERSWFGVNLVFVPPFQEFKGVVGCQLKVRF